MYSEHEKLEKINDQSQIIGEFLEWLNYEKGYCLCENLGKLEHWHPVSENHEKLLSQYFNIDLNKLEQEKRQMLEKLRKINNG